MAVVVFLATRVGPSCAFRAFVLVALTAACTRFRHTHAHHTRNWWHTSRKLCGRVCVWGACWVRALVAGRSSPCVRSRGGFSLGCWGRSWFRSGSPDSQHCAQPSPHGLLLLLLLHPWVPSTTMRRNKERGGTKQAKVGSPGRFLLLTMVRRSTKVGGVQSPWPTAHELTTWLPTSTRFRVRFVKRILRSHSPPAIHNTTPIHTRG